MELICKSTIVAEINKRLQANGAFDTAFDDAWLEDVGMCNAYKSILSFIDTLEVKEVNLEKEIELWMESNIDDTGYFNTLEFAKYFFELKFKV